MGVVSPVGHRPGLTRVLRHEHLTDLLARSRESTRTVQRLFETLDAPQLTWKPEPGRWNIVECVDHLVTTGGLYLPAVQGALDRARARGRRSEAPCRFTWFGKWFVGMAGPEVRRKLPAPRAFVPQTEASYDPAIASRFGETQCEIERLVQEADGWPLNGRKFRSPVTPLVRLTLGEGLTLLVWHTQRHVNQASRLTELPGFPPPTGL